MATSEALIKYYDCLKDSFNKIQDKDNKTALENAALRPKIREEFVKSRKVLYSYLDYIKIFSVIYSDKFISICNNIITPLFREDEIQKESQDDCTDNEVDYTEKIHQALQAIINSKPELAIDFVRSVIRIFPNILDNRECFIPFLKNCLKICTYVEGEALAVLVAKILERLNPPRPTDTQEQQEIEEIKKILDKSYEVIFEHLKELDDSQFRSFAKILINTFVNEYLASTNELQLNLLLLYVCSRDSDSTNLLLESLWNIFTDPIRSTSERKASVMFSSSFIARANYLNLDKVFEYLEAANNWCREFLKDYEDSVSNEDNYNENIDSFYALFQSMLYLITQRYREMYEEESIAKLSALNLNQIIKSHLKPLEVCDKQLESRFQEVAALYNIAQIDSAPNLEASRKRRKSDYEFKTKSPWLVPFDESGKVVPKQLKDIYRCYHSHRIFTVYRE